MFFLVAKLSLVWLRSTRGCAVPYPEDKMSRTFLLPEYRSSVHHVLFRACTCDTYDTNTRQAEGRMQKRHFYGMTVPFLGEVVRGVVGLEMDPLPGGQVQPVQICAVNVTRCASKDVQEAVYNDHRLQKETHEAFTSFCSSWTDSRF